MAEAISNVKKSQEEKVDGYLSAASTSLLIAERLASPKRARRIHTLRTKVEELREDQ